MPPPGLYL